MSPETLMKYGMKGGPAAAQTLYPSRQTYNARTIPIAEDIIELMQGRSGGGSKRTPPPSREAPGRRTKTRINPYD